MVALNGVHMYCMCTHKYKISLHSQSITIGGGRKYIHICMQACGCMCACANDFVVWGQMFYKIKYFIYLTE